MAENKKSFVLYVDQIGLFDKLPDEKAGQLIKHIFKYVNDENPQIVDDILLDIAFDPIKRQLKRDLKTWERYIEKQSENGKKGGRPKKAKESQKTQRFKNKPKKADTVTVTVTDNVIDNLSSILSVETDREKILEIWNGYVLKSKCKNKTIKQGENIFTRCRGITKDIEKECKRLRLKIEDFEHATRQYALERCERNPESDYANHSFSLYDFLKQSNGFIKYFNYDK